MPAIAIAAPDTAQISKLLSQGKFDEAQAALDKSSPTQADRIFFHALAMKITGNLAQAIEEFREVLRIDPQYINARRELAHTLLMADELDVAAFHFNELMDIDQNPRMRAGYRQFLNIIEQNKPYGISGSFSLLPSTNINSGTTNVIFVTDIGPVAIDSPPQSGVGAQIALNGFFRKKISQRSQFMLNWGVTTINYENTDYNSVTGNLSLAFHRSSQHSNWSIGPYYRQTWKEDGNDSSATGVRFSISHRLSDSNQLTVSLNSEYQTNPAKPYQDGYSSGAQFNLRHQINPALSVTAGLSGRWNRSRAAHLQYNDTKISVGVSKAWEGGLHTSLGLNYGDRPYIGVFPALSVARHDSYYGVNFEIYNSTINYMGFTPRLSCSYTENWSNVAFFDYEVTSCQATISRNF
ncbi:MAG: surface lipoprotein assembly modifier [Paracoccaceae bacterium]